MPQKYNHTLSSTQRGYGYRWQQERKTYLKLNPLCVFCAKDSKVEEANVVDHIIPHKGDEELFWDTDNWQALCKHCHDSTKKVIETRGYSIEVGEDGFPIDPKHPVNGRGDIEK